MRRVLMTCPSFPLPANGSVRVNTTAGGSSSNAPVSTRSSTPPATTATTSAVRVFQNCTAARAAGEAPMYAPSALYKANKRLDRDKDGVACE
jgi:hypothetical protein